MGIICDVSISRHITKDLDWTMRILCAKVPDGESSNGKIYEVVLVKFGCTYVIHDGDEGPLLPNR